jgi:hypothetical protein
MKKGLFFLFTLLVSLNMVAQSKKVTKQSVLMAASEVYKLIKE